MVPPLTALGRGAHYFVIFGKDPSDADEGATAVSKIFLMMHFYTWKDRDSLHDFGTVVIDLFSDVTKKNISAYFRGDEIILQVSFKWLRFYFNFLLTVVPWFNSTNSDRITKDHPRRMSYEESIKSKRPNKKTRISSVCNLRPPFKVRKKVRRSFGAR